MQRDFTVSEAATELALSEGRVRALITSGKLLGRWARGAYTIRESDLRAFQALDRKPGRPRKTAAVNASEKGARDGDATS